MTNDSTQPGYLTSTDTGPEYDEALERQISRWICGVTGLPTDMVMPRWTEPQPQNGLTWCGFGLSVTPRDGTPASIQGGESSEQWTWEQVTVLSSFYGPSGAGIASRFREGVAVEQNATTLRSAAGLSLIETGQIYSLPELINDEWVRRYDIITTLSRKNIRTYGVKSLVDGSISISGE
ncbi:phage neck terminator protein [Pantoea agglomerans]|uniref:phage neck terminator protein n=1 Tax=Enterobacter agglomerans TaxID=549 RepID=UPI002542DE84|nr:hypothetical protein [Pantoea agglomerans]MDK4216354.1 hypothetical protein [Pantoea agglomerans]